MKTAHKLMLTVLCIVLVVVVSAMGTLAYLTDNDADVNTFIVGKVDISIDETDVDNSTPGDNDRDKENEYHLLPGHTYVKDPMVTVLGGSEETYVRMLVEVVNIEALKEAMPKEKEAFKDFYSEDLFLLQMLCNGWDANNWAYVDCENGVYEFRYVGSEDQGSKAGTVKKTDADIKLDPLFDAITVPGEVDNDGIAKLKDVKIVVTAHAIQAAGFDTADAAWAAFESQK